MLRLAKSSNILTGLLHDCWAKALFYNVFGYLCVKKQCARLIVGYFNIFGLISYVLVTRIVSFVCVLLLFFFLNFSIPTFLKWSFFKNSYTYKSGCIEYSYSPALLCFSLTNRKQSRQADEWGFISDAVRVLLWGSTFWTQCWSFVHMQFFSIELHSSSSCIARSALMSTTVCRFSCKLNTVN